MGLPPKPVYGPAAYRQRRLPGWAGGAHPKHKSKGKAVERGVKMLLRAKIIDLGPALH